MAERRYKFTWDFVGNVETGRPNLGLLVPVELYRLFQYTMRDVLEERLGTDEADLMLYKAGFLGGREFFKRYVAPCENLTEFVSKSKAAMAEKKMGIMRVEAADPESMEFTIAVSEDLDCSGLPELSHGVCNYDEGFIAGLLEAFTNKKCDVREVACWCTGDRVCRFSARLAGEQEHGA